MEQAFVIRPARLEDLEWFHSISHMVGAGFTSIQNDREYLQKRLTIVDKSFKEKIPVHERVYLFVLENLPQHEMIGLCGIDVAIGHKESFYNYQISTVTQSNKKLNIFMMHTLLNVVNNFQNASEIISFWLHPDYRGLGLSRSLSLARFMFIAEFKHLFAEEIIAELRGMIDENGKSPFWEALGKNFFGMDFKRADALTAKSGKQFISDLVSREPIYLDLLPLDAQKVVAVEHPDSSPARHLLESQGFKFNNHIDIFDGGPVLSANRDSIKIIADSKIATISMLQDNLDNNFVNMLYNNRMDARITVGNIQLLENDAAIISPQIAEILDVKVGDQLRYCHL